MGQNESAQRGRHRPRELRFVSSIEVTEDELWTTDVDGNTDSDTECAQDAQDAHEEAPDEAGAQAGGGAARPGRRIRRRHELVLNRDGSFTLTEKLLALVTRLVPQKRPPRPPLEDPEDAPPPPPPQRVQAWETVHEVVYFGGRDSVYMDSAVLSRHDRLAAEEASTFEVLFHAHLENLQRKKHASRGLFGLTKLQPVHVCMQVQRVEYRALDMDKLDWRCDGICDECSMLPLAEMQLGGDADGVGDGDGRLPTHVRGLIAEYASSADCGLQDVRSDKKTTADADFLASPGCFLISAKFAARICDVEVQYMRCHAGASDETPLELAGPFKVCLKNNVQQ